MNSKTNFLILSAFSFLVITFAAGFGSAQVFNMDLVSQPASVQSTATSFQVVFNATYTGTSDSFNFNLSSSTVSGTISSMTFSESNPINLAIGQTITITATVNIPAGQSGNIAGTIIGNPSGTATADSVQFSVPVTGGSSNFALTVAKAGAGSGIITSSPSGINCGSDCAESYASGTNVILTAAASSGSSFSGWSGACSGTSSTCTVTMNAAKSVTATFGTINFCKNGNLGELEITKFKIDNTGTGKDDEWELLDTISVQVKAENTGDDDIDDVNVRLGILDGNGKNVVNDFDFTNSDEDEINIGDLGDGDDDTVTFEFRVPADIDSGNYRLIAKAYSDGAESTQCTDLLDGDQFREIKVKRTSDEGRFILFDKIQSSPTEATCGDSVSLMLDVLNVGDKDQDQVKINLKNSELKIDQSVEIRNNLDKGDSQQIRFDFTVPQNAQNKAYTLLLSSEYDYRSSSNTYRQDSDEDTPVTLKVLGCAGGSTGGNNGTGGSGSGATGRTALISASLGSDSIAGETFSVKAKITNVGATKNTYVLDVNGFDSWAELDSISKKSLTLDSGEEAEVTIKFKVNEDAEGDQSFTIETISNGKTESRDVTVEVAPKQSQGFSFNLGGGNTYLWIIGAVNVILIILIIVVAVRISRR